MVEMDAFLTALGGEIEDVEEGQLIPTRSFLTTARLLS